MNSSRASASATRPASRWASRSGQSGQRRRARHGSQRPARPRSASAPGAGASSGRRGCRRRSRGPQGTRDEIGPQPIEEAALVPGRSLVVTGDRAQLGGELAVRDQRSERLVRGRGRAGMRSGRRSRRPSCALDAPPRDEVRIDRHDDVARVQEPLDERPVTRFEDHPYRSRVRLERGDARDQRFERRRAVVDACDGENAVARSTEGHDMELLGKVDPDAEHGPSSRVARIPWPEARRRADGPVLAGRHPCWHRASEAALRGCRLIEVLKGQALRASPEGGLCGRG